MMTVRTAVEDEQPRVLSRCWCCGELGDPDRLVHLGDHPEVGVCVRCAHSLSKWASELEDQARTGAAARVRGHVRRLRKVVVEHGWHQNKVIGRGLRWIGRFIP